MAGRSRIRTLIAPHVGGLGRQGEPGKVVKVAKATATAAKATHSYVQHKPDTRWPALCLILLYPLGEMGHSMGWSSWLLAAFCPLVAVAAGYAIYKEYGNCRYMKVSTVLLAAVPGWLAVAATVGTFHLKVLAAYSTAAVVLWLVYAHCEIITERAGLRAAKVDWAKFLPQVGLKDATVVRAEPTRLGMRVVVDVRKTKQGTAHKVNRPELTAAWASHKSIGKHRVTAYEDDGHAGQLIVEERTKQPWEEPNGHPTLDPSSEWKLPAQRSIHDGPLEIGADPSTGALLALPVYADRSCRHVLVVATTGGGKTVCISCLMERITACNDTLAWPIDTTKGTLAGLWRDAVDWGAGVGEHAKALSILRATKTVIEQRSRLSDGENHFASPTAPVIFLLIDEAGSMQGGMSARQAAEYRELIGFVFRSARSAGIVMVFLSQRGVIQHTGSGDTRANADLRVCGKVKSSAEMEYAIPDWQASGFPDMSKYGEGYAGVIAIAGTGVPPMTGGRTWDLSDFPTVRKLAARRGAPTARLEPAIAAMLGEPYAQRRGGVLVPAGRAPVEMEENGMPDEFDTITAALADIDRSCDELAAMQIPEDQRVPMSDLLAARAQMDAEDRKTEVPDMVRSVVPGMLASAAEQGHPGLSRADLVRLLGELFKDQAKPRTVERWLRRLVLDGVIARSGATSNAVYVLPDPSA